MQGKMHTTVTNHKQDGVILPLAITIENSEIENFWY